MNKNKKISTVTLVSLITLIPDFVLYSYIGLSHYFFDQLLKNEFYEILFGYVYLFKMGIPFYIALTLGQFFGSGNIASIICYTLRILVALETGFVAFYFKKDKPISLSTLYSLIINYLLSIIFIILTFLNFNFGPPD